MFDRSSFFKMHTLRQPHAVTLVSLSASFSVFVSSFFWFFGDTVSLFPCIFVPLPFSPCMESTSYRYVFSFRMMFFYLVTTGWIFDMRLCENSIKQ